MNKINQPLVYKKIEQSELFSGRALISFLEIAHKEATGEFLSLPGL